MPIGSFQLSAQQVLDGICGPAYVLDEAARFLLVGRPYWRLQVDDAPGQIEPGDLIGRNLFDFIQGDDVRDLYLRVLARLRAKASAPVQLIYRCDSPGMMREFRMTASVVADGDSRGYLFTSQQIRHGQRPPLPLFDYQALAAFLHDPTAPILTICSMCHRVKSRAGDEDDPRSWVEPEQYYREGGSSHVSLSHGLCPACYVQFIAEVDLAPNH
jgi:hypothetical protein